ncbi:MAG: DUF4422 domain-containing protein [Lachnospira sp.]|nr:DUF4422 domain-containing protein [Lachnospira sp.]
MKVLIYGIGKVFNKYRHYIKWSSVVGITDSSITKWGSKIENFIVQSPTCVYEQKYDYIVIFSDDYFKEIKDVLRGEYGISETKIVSYAFFIEDYNLWSEEARQLTCKFISESQGAILDTDAVGYARYRRCYRKDKLIVNYAKCKYPYQVNYYSAKEANDYTAVMLWDEYDKCISDQSVFNINPEKILWTIPYNYLKNNKFINQLKQLQMRYFCSEFRFLNEILLWFERGNKDNNGIDNIKIYQVCHKQYFCINNDIYKTIKVGNSKFEADYSDDTGINIAKLNSKINECTAIYWIWKNTNSDFVGINHYRRHFFKSNIKEIANVISHKEIVNILKDDKTIILPELTRMDISILDNICMSVGDDVCLNILPDVKEVIKKVQPDYLKSFEAVLSGNVMYRCNMFITSWKIFDEYCTWLFSFIIQLAEEIDVSNYSTQEKRVVGYFAEIMLTVWLNNQVLQIKEFPISDV